MRVRNTKQIATALEISIQTISREAREGRLKVADCSVVTARTYTDEALAQWLLQDGIRSAKKLDLPKDLLLTTFNKLWKGQND